MIPSNSTDGKSDREKLAADYLRLLWPVPTDDYLLLWRLQHLPDKSEIKESLWFPLSGDFSRVALAAVEMSEHSNAYLGCAASPKDYGPGKRCEANSVSAIPGLWADIDFVHAAHKKTNLPPDLASAVALANAMPRPPSLIVHSGHGVYAWWLFKQPWPFADDDERTAAAALVVSWQEYLRELAKERGWTTDSTGDFARVLRLVGTINHKGGDRLPVTVEIPSVVARYDPHELRKALPPAKPKTKGKPKSKTKDGDKTESSAKPLLADDEALLNKAKSARDGDKFKGLWSGSTAGYDSPSEADLALCNLLAFWCGPYEDRIDRLFRRSGLMRADKWNEKHFSNGSTYGEATVAKALDGRTEFYRNGKPASSTTVQDDCAKPTDATKQIEVGRLKLILTGARKTQGGKVVASISVWREGSEVDAVTVTSVVSSRRDAVKAIAQRDPDGDKYAIDEAVGKLMVTARDLANKERDREGETLFDVVRSSFAEKFRPAYRTGAGFFSESEGREIKLLDVARHIPSSLVAAAEKAKDAPRLEDGSVCRPALVKALKTEIEIVFADLTTGLPAATDAELAANSAAAKEFRNAMVRLFTATKSWEQGQEGQTKRASLISRAATAFRQNQRETNLWQPVIDACACWWRRHTDESGEMRKLLAMRWELAWQIDSNKPLPGVDGQDALTTLGIKYGVVDGNPPVPTKVKAGTVRIAVLSWSFTESLLNMQGNFSDDPEPTKPHGQGGASV